MKQVTALRSRIGRGKRVNVYLDGRFAFSLEAEVALTEGLKVGQELTGEYISTLGKADDFQRCLNAAMRYLSYRPRSEFELRERLYRRNFDDESINGVVARLKELALVDDREFAKFWRDNRRAFSPRSSSLTKLELRRKGVAEEVISQVVNPDSDGEGAYRAALGKARQLPVSDYQSFRHRLGEYLRRRGFNYGIINKTVRKLWQEMKESDFR